MDTHLVRRTNMVGEKQHQQGQREWLEVRHRRIQMVVARKFVWTARRGKCVGKVDTLSTFFFTGFPISFEEKETYEVFKEFGLVVEVVIPTRRDKRGKQYGFVRFGKVGDKSVMVVKLDTSIFKERSYFLTYTDFNVELM